MLLSTLGVLAALTFNPEDPLDPAYDWFDCSEAAALEGRAFPGVAAPYARIPEKFRAALPEKAWTEAQTAIGFAIRFTTDSDAIKCRWDYPAYPAPPHHWSMMSHAGINVYSRRPGQDKWRVVGYWSSGSLRYPGTKKDYGYGGAAHISWRPGDEVLIYLPCHVQPVNFAFGVKKGKTIKRDRPHAVAKPVVMYGGAAVNGIEVSRPGMVLTSLISRLADVEVANLGLNGAAMEEPMADVLAASDASLYVIACENDMTVEQVKANYEKFLKRLSALKPDTPVLLVGAYTIEEGVSDTEKCARAIFEKLKKADPAKFAQYHYLPGAGLLPKSDDALMDGVHPNDHGFMCMAPVLADAIKKILVK